MEKNIYCAGAGIRTPVTPVAVHEVRGLTIEATLTMFFTKVKFITNTTDMIHTFADWSIRQIIFE